MTNRLIQVELDLVIEIQEYIEDHDPHKLECILEADNTIAEFKTCMDRFRRCHTELKLALGEDYRDKYTGRDETRKTFRIYLGELETRGRALRREKDTRETNERKLEKTLDRAVTEKLEVERAARKITAAAYRLETSATIAQEAMWLDEASTYRDWSIQAIDRAISDAKMHLKEFRMAHLNLSKILGDNYSQEQIINFKAISEETGRKISDLERVLREKDKIRHKSKVTQGEQAVKEIKLRCATLSSILGRSPTKLPDSQLLEANKGLVQINADVSKILDRVTEFAGYVSEIGASDQLDLINVLVADTLDEKNTYVKSVRDEVEARDLSKEKIRNALGLKIEIPRFCGYDSAMDIYTFREKFEKFVAPYVQKPLLPDTLKMNYLGDPALTLVKELKNMDEIWDQLFNAYGNAQLLLLNKLGDLSKISGLDKIKGRENLMHGISSLINAMTELGRLAGKYSLEHFVYPPSAGLGKVRELMGWNRYDKFIEKNEDIPLGYKEEWDGILRVLRKELNVTQRQLIADKSSQPLVSFEPEISFEEESENISGGAEIYSTSVKDRKKPI